MSTDTKAFCNRFDISAAIPTQAAIRLMKWSIMLCAYNYALEFKPTKNHHSKFIIMLTHSSINENQVANLINTMLVDSFPNTAEHIREATQKDKVIELVLDYSKSGL